LQHCVEEIDSSDANTDWSSDDVKTDWHESCLWTCTNFCKLFSWTF